MSITLAGNALLRRIPGVALDNSHHLYFITKVIINGTWITMLNQNVLQFSGIRPLSFFLSGNVIVNIPLGGSNSISKGETFFLILSR